MCPRVGVAKILSVFAHVTFTLFHASEFPSFVITVNAMDVKQVFDNSVGNKTYQDFFIQSIPGFEIFSNTLKRTALRV